MKIGTIIGNDPHAIKVLGEGGVELEEGEVSEHEFFWLLLISQNI